MKPSKPVSFSDSNEQAEDAKARARAAVARAKGQNAGRPSDLNLNQRFDQAADNTQATPTTLRPETQRGLEDMMEEAKRQAQARASAAATEDASTLEIKPSKLHRFSEKLLDRRFTNPEEDLAEAVQIVAKELHLPDPPSKEEADRIEWEASANLEPLSIDPYILNGFLQQTVPVIPGKLNVTFRTTFEGTEAHVENKIRELRRESGAGMLISEFYRHQARLAVACQVVSYGPAKWPSLLDASGEVDTKAFDVRLSLVKQIPSQIFPKVAQHLGWFNARVETLLKDPEVLGNG